MPDSHRLEPEAPAAPLRHGGDLAQASQSGSSYKGPWLDLSTGISPWRYAIGTLPEALWTRLPASALLAQLAAAAARCYGAPGPDAVAAAPGTQALIQWLPRLRPAGRVAVLGPTYGEHARAWREAGHAVTTLAEPAALEGEWEVAKPNNPDGRALAPQRLLDLAGRQAARGGWLVVDEAFADAMPELSIAHDCAAPGLVVLRSFGKFFGLAGLRLGFALAHPAFIRNLREALGPWPVSGPAAWIATEALADRAWIEATRRRLVAGAARLEAMLREAGLGVAGGTPLFRLAAHPQAPAINRALLRHGIYVRAFPERPEWLRFGLPVDASAAARLRRVLEACRDAGLHDNAGAENV
jgi:cobalamin biosynthetic protein CobC